MPEVFNDIIHNGIPGHSDVLHSSTSVGFPGHCWLPPKAGSLHPRPLTLDPSPHEVVHWDQWPHSCHSAVMAVIYQLDISIRLCLSVMVRPGSDKLC